MHTAAIATTSATNSLVQSLRPRVDIRLRDPRKFLNAIEAAGRIVSTFSTSTNELIESWMVDAVDALKADGLFKREIKKYYGEARKAIHQNIVQLSTLYSGGGHTDLYLDFVDVASDIMTGDVKTLYYTILQALTKNGVDKAKSHAHVETVRILMAMSARAYDELFIDIKHKWDFDLSSGYSVARPTGALHFWKLMQKQVDKSFKGCHTDLNSFPDIKLAADVIDRKWQRAEYIDKALRASFDSHPEEVPEGFEFEPDCDPKGLRGFID